MAITAGGILVGAVVSSVYLALVLGAYKMGVVPAEIPFLALLLVPVAVLFAIGGAYASAWHTRWGDLRPLADARVAQSVTTSTSNLLGALFSTGGLMLVAGMLVGAFVYLGAQIRRRIVARALSIRVISLAQIAGALRQEAGRIKYSGPAGILNAVGLYFPTILIGMWYGAQNLGWFALMLRLAVYPTLAFTAGASQSFLAEVSAAARNNPADISARYARTKTLLTVLGTVAAIVCLCGPMLVGVLLGAAKWSGAGWTLFALAPVVLVQVVASPLSPAITVLGHERWILLWDVARSSSIVLAITACGLLHLPYEIALCAYSIIMAVTYAVMLRKMDSMLMLVRR
ncbi:MATE family efflux transporter [Ramlibacter alkalitolerans]|uniref:Polysaccharide biosynthesis protein n=1 Tax=Ramlibacter alkalitolerans TaxID=2039631 RepID=A0ABS1JWU5_9BURK|nr:hypothetical protein [Ramlibacter alkalitolerans]MBL0428684.1 hypothetical protein [Ramlibacter alkalitolerans]